MLKRGLQTIFSPTDLTQYMDSGYGSWMQRLSIEQPGITPPRDDADALMSSLQHKGEAFEQQVLADFRQQGLTVTDLTAAADSTTNRADPSRLAATLAAMQRGDEVIYQAYLEHDGFRGFADFLIKTPGSSALGEYYYEVWDSKLSKSIKPAFILQLCCYAELLEAMQGLRPPHIAIIGGGGEPSVRLNTDDYYYFYQGLKHNFIAFQQRFDADQPPAADSFNSWGNWSQYAGEQLLAIDHLSQVATISRGQIKKLNAAGITTLQQLASLKIDATAGSTVSDLNQQQLIRLQRQAAIQYRSRQQGGDVPAFEIIPPAIGERIGLALLPPPSGLDIFFDIEGYPLAEGGLEYLWGSSYIDDDGERQFKDFWAHDSRQEKQAFHDFIQWAYQRWQQDPSMHIYHYANYEIAACRRLMGRYGICEFEVDELLRNEVFVDLYKIVKAGILLGEPRYSIKNVEHLYRAKRDTEVANGGDSVVVYEQWRDNPDGDNWQQSKILNDIRLYNIDDCDSTLELVDWLRVQQISHGIDYLAIEQKPPAEVNEQLDARAQLRDRLLTQAEGILDSQPEQATLLQTLAWSLEFHRREAKPVFWRLFDRLGMEHDELIDDLDCLAYCRRSASEPYKPTPRARNLAYDYHFDANQAFKGGKFSSFYLLGGEGQKVTMNKDFSDLNHGKLVLTSKEEPAATISLIPDEYINPRPIPEAIASVVSDFSGASEQAPNAIVEFLQRHKPRFVSGHSNNPGGAIVEPASSRSPLEQISAAVLALDHSYLTIQGPPGAGKTYTGKHLIADLLAAGQRVGICSNSHKAINNLLISTAKHCQGHGQPGYFACTGDTGEDFDQLGIELIKNNKIADTVDDKHSEFGGVVIGTTAWGFSRDDVADQFDYLFIDEAGQVSVANLIAISQSCRNIVLMGDQQQLGQPTQGCHPGDSGLSVLDYLLHDTPTIADDCGVFLATSYRMHPSICRFISAAIYQHKLDWAPHCDQQVLTLDTDEPLLGNIDAGIIYCPIEHSGNSQASDEEVAAIAQLSQALVGRRYHDTEGNSHDISLDDMLFIAPYNHQVNNLKAALGEQIKAGSVDRFQGQEAPVIFLSLCASDANDSPRGLDFLFDKNRLNVAISRAQCLVVIVASKQLENTEATNIEQLQKLNTYHQLLAYSTEVSLE